MGHVVILVKFEPEGLVSRDEDSRVIISLARGGLCKGR